MSGDHNRRDRASARVPHGDGAVRIALLEICAANAVSATSRHDRVTPSIRISNFAPALTVNWVHSRYRNPIGRQSASAAAAVRDGLAAVAAAYLHKPSVMTPIFTAFLSVGTSSRASTENTEILVHDEPSTYVTDSVTPAGSLTPADSSSASPPERLGSSSSSCNCIRIARARLSTDSRAWSKSKWLPAGIAATSA
jgi:hypothetical protein